VLSSAGLCHAGAVYGLIQTGAMSREYVAAVLCQTESETCELYFHPSTDATGTPLGANQGDLRTLIDPEIRSIVEHRGIELTTYAALQSASP
jgi:hypothetical protein